MKFRMIIVTAVLIAIATIIFADIPPWQWLNGPYVGRAKDITIGSDVLGKVLYAANNESVLYWSANEGQDWMQTQMNEPTCVITVPNNPRIAYTGGNYWKVYKTTDRGVTWNPKVNGIGDIAPLCLALDPSDFFANFVLLGSAYQSDNAVFFRTFDGGISWEARNVATNQMDVCDIAVVSSLPHRIYLAGGKTGPNLPDSGFYLSTNDGATFQRTLEADVRTVAYDATNPQNVWEGEIRLLPPYDERPRGTVRRSMDGGLTWIPDQNSPPYFLPKGVTITSLAVTNTSGVVRIYAATDSGVFLSMDNGQNWNEINNGIYMRFINSIATDPEDAQNLYLGGKISLYRSNNGGGNWEERTKGMEFWQNFAISTNLPDVCYCLGLCAVHKTTNQGQGWVTVDNGEVYGTRYDIVTDITNPLRAFHVGERAMDVNYVRRTTNGGLTWTDLLDPINATYTSVAIDPTNGQIVYVAFHVPTGPPPPYGLQKSTDGGDTWEELTAPGNDIASLCIDYWSHNTVFAGASGPSQAHIYKTTDGGTSWNTYYLPPTDESAVSDICSNSIVNKVYANVSLYYGIYKSTDGGENWTNCGLIGNMKALAMDPEEPEILYSSAGDNQGRTFVTVDGGAVWIEHPDHLPRDVEDMTIDLNQPTSVYCATANGAYKLTPTWPFKSLTASSPQATSNNNGRKMLAGMTNIWITYESGGVIYAVHSGDAGITWSRKMEIGKGYNPTISSNPNNDPPSPGIVWWARGTRDTLYYSKLISDYSWTSPSAIVTTDYNFGPPSFIIGTDNIGRVVYTNTGNGKIYYGEFNINNPPQINPENVGIGINPSIGFMPSGSNNPEIHVVWEDNLKVKYRPRRISGGWSSEETVYSSNSHRPSIEIAGSTVYVICERSPNIDYRYAVYTQNGQHTAWSKIKSFSSQYTLGYPVLSGGNAMSCVANVNGKGEVYFWYNPGGPTWIGPINISNTANVHSEYPHIVHRQTIAGTVVHFTWTENDNPAYDIRFANYSLGGYDSNEDLAFYVAQGGDTLASPFNLKRTGFVEYGAELYKHVDYDNRYLEYEFCHLDPQKDYALTAYAYQKGYAHLLLTLKVDNVLIGGIILPPETLITFKKLVPYNFYTDSVLNIKIFGNKAVGSAFVLHQYERESGGCGGPQSQNTTPVSANQLTMTIYPTTVKNNFTIEFSLANKSQIAIELYDITGRLVKELLKSEITAGKHRYAFSASDLPQGIYFIHLDTSGFHSIGKIISIK